VPPEEAVRHNNRGSDRVVEMGLDLKKEMLSLRGEQILLKAANLL